ncbi:MAG TPA: hypothetical protein VH142_07750 [Polyangiaceae bacterium]|nr:hypothetical protein [Polyangiaceae bacterium]
MATSRVFWQPDATLRASPNGDTRTARLVLFPPAALLVGATPR